MTPPIGRLEPGGGIHPTLARQLRRSGLDAGSRSGGASGDVPWELFEEFLKRVNRSYRQSEESRYLLERSMEVSSDEMRQLYADLEETSTRLIEAEQGKLRAVIGALDHGVCAVESGGRILFMNAAAEGMLQCTPADGRELMERVVVAGPDGVPFDPVVLVDLIAGGGRLLETGAVVNRCDGSQLAVSATLSPLYTGGDDEPGMVLVFHDMTDHYDTVANLGVALEEAEKAAESKDRFMATVSHEIRTPLNGVIGMIDLLMGTDLDDEQQQFAETVKGSGESLLEIINEILDYSKLAAGKVELDLTEFEVAKLAEDVAALLAPRAASGNVAVSVLVEEGLPSHCEADQGRIRQVLTNLVGNAVKFSQDGEVVIRLSAAPVVGEVVSALTGIRFEVRDTGIGIAPDRIADLFSPFTQAEVSTSRLHGGTGLGLAISKELVRLMDGEIGVDSEQGVGSTFYFTVPVRPVGPVSGVGDDLEELPPDLRALVVDDSETNRFVVREYLGRMGCRVVEAESGIEAFTKAQLAAEIGSPFDIIVTDAHMEPMGGLELVRSLRTHPGTAEATVMVLTSVVHSATDRRQLLQLADSLLMKPVRQAPFRDAVARSYWRRRSRDDSLGTGDVRAEEATSEVEGGATEQRRRSRGLRILVAEDNATNQLVIGHLLARMGHECVSVGNGREAVERLAVDAFDVVLMDCMMPVMDGYEASRRIRQLDGEVATVPIVALTASALAGDREKCIAAGMNDYLSKPVRSDDLAAKLESVAPSVSS